MRLRNSWRGITAAALALVSALAFADYQHRESAANGSSIWHARTLQFDVAESMPKFVFDEAPVLPNGMPAYGIPFVTQGYIYPTGTLEGSSGVLADGSPEFPDIVIGEWTCRGYMIGEGADTTSGPWVITTQHYDFYEEPGYAEGKQSGRTNLVTEGYELADIGVESSRAVTGGTGRFAKARGQARQTFLGFNDSEGVRLRAAAALRHDGHGPQYLRVRLRLRARARTTRLSAHAARDLLDGYHSAGGQRCARGARSDAMALRDRHAQGEDRSRHLPLRRGRFAGYLLEHERIDRLVVKLNPVVIGGGVPLFDGAAQASFTALSAQRHDSGVVTIVSERVR